MMRRLLQHEQEGANLLVASWGHSFEALQEMIRKIDVEIAGYRERGEEITRGLVTSSDSYQGLMDALSLELRRQGGAVVNVMRSQDGVALKSGARDALRMIEAVFPGASQVKEKPGVIVSMLAAARGDRSTKALSNALVKKVDEGVQETVLTSLTSGRTLGATVDKVREAWGTGLTASLRINRNGTLGAYRVAQMAEFKANDISEWQWLCEKDERTCLACLVYDGKVFPTTEFMPAHMGCRCLMVPHKPGVPGVEAAGEPIGEEWLQQQGEDEQRRIMGDDLFEAWSTGQVPFDNLAEIVRDKYGPHVAINWDAAQEAQAQALPIEEVPPEGVIPWRDQLTQESLTVEEMQRIVDDPELREVQGKVDALQAQLDDFQRQTKDTYQRFPLGTTTAEQDRECNRILLDLQRQKNEIEQQMVEAKQPWRDLSSALQFEEHGTIDVSVVGRNVSSDRLGRFEGDVGIVLRDVERYLPPGEFEVNVLFDPTSIRSSYSALDNRLYLADAKSAAHEFGHRLEDIQKGWYDSAKAFLEYRTQGEPLVSVTPSGSRGIEMGKPDRFFSPYVGKVYDHATEIISMGFEAYFEDPYGFASKDPEHFVFIYNLLRGNLWQSP